MFSRRGSRRIKLSYELMESFEKFPEKCNKRYFRFMKLAFCAFALWNKINCGLCCAAWKRDQNYLPSNKVGKIEINDLSKSNVGWEWSGLPRCYKFKCEPPHPLLEIELLLANGWIKISLLKMDAGVMMNTEKNLTNRTFKKLETFTYNQQPLPQENIFI